MEKNKLSYYFSTVMICLFLFCTLGCQQDFEENKKGQNEAREYQKTEEILGTIISCKVIGENGDKGLEKAFERVREIESIMSAKLDNSELTKVNQMAAKQPITISEELYKVVETALYYAEISNGAFDPTIGRLVDLWGIGTEQAGIPDKEELEPYINRKNYKNVKLDKKESTIFFEKEEIKLDLGGIAKGYAGDEMKRILIEEFQIKSGILSLGGNVVAIGKKTDGALWNVGIANPFETSEVFASLQIVDKAVVTSGNYERFFLKDQVRYHHILDPDTGYPAENGFVSTTIYGENSMDADALSTAAYIMGKEKAVELIETLQGYEGIFISSEGEMSKTSGIKEDFFTLQ